MSKDQTMTNRYTYVKSRGRWYVIDTADREARHTYDYTEIRGQIVAEFPRGTKRVPPANGAMPSPLAPPRLGCAGRDRGATREETTATVRWEQHGGAADCKGGVQEHAAAQHARQNG